MLSLSVIALVALSGSPPLVDDRPRPEAFLGSIEAAQELAREFNKPFVVIIVQESEEANERFRDGLLFTDDFTDAMSGALVLLVNDGAHEMITKRVVVDGERREIQVCGIFHTPNCEEHRRNWDAVAQVFSEDGVVRTPQVVMVSPLGEIHSRIHDVPPGGAAPYLAVIQELQHAAGPALTREQLIAVRALLPGARTTAADSDWIQAHAAWSAVLLQTQGGVYADEARAGLERALTGMRELLDSATTRMQEGEVAEGYEMLLDLAEALEDTPLERDAVRALRTAERNRDWKDVIDAVKHEREAAALLAEVDAFVAAGEQRKALRPLRKLMRRFEGTHAYALAQRRHAGLVEELGLDDERV